MTSRKMINRSPVDRRQTTHVPWNGIERRQSGENREHWKRHSTWASSHKPFDPIRFHGAHQLLP